MSSIVIALDGPAASGKGTLGRALAKNLKLAYLDTGALYRAVAFEVVSNGFSVKDKKDAVSAAQILSKKIAKAHDPSEILANPALRQDEIGSAASIVAAIPEVREALKTLQRNFAKNPSRGYQGAILDGRDIGTVICPNADIKLYITASTEIRAERRLKELQSKGISVTYGAVLKDMRERDARDASRDTAPMKPAEDAIQIDSSDLSAAEMLDKALGLIKERLNIS